MTVNLSHLLQNPTSTNPYVRGTSAGRETGLFIQDTATVTAAADGFGNLQFTASGLPTASAAGQVPVSTGAGNVYAPQTQPETLISTTTVASSSPTVTIALPTGYTFLRLVSMTLPVTATDGLLCGQIGTDTTAANYFISGQANPYGGGVTSLSAFTSASGIIFGAIGQGSALINTGAVKEVAGFGSGSGGNTGSVTFAGIYAGANPIGGSNLVLSLGKLTANPGDSLGINIAAGSIFKLYGVN